METRCLHREKVEIEVSSDRPRKKLGIFAPEWLKVKLLEDMLLWGEVKPLTLEEQERLQVDLLKQVFEQR